MIEKWREQMDNIDKQLLFLISKRFRLAKKISSWKKKHGLAIIDKKREKELIDNVSKEAKKLGIDEKFAKEIFKKIIKETRKREKCER